MMKLLFVLIFFGLSNSAYSQNRVEIYHAFTAGDMGKWKAKIVEIEANKPTRFVDKLELVNFYYGYIGYLLGIKNKREAQVYVDKGDLILTQLLDSNSQSADVYAYKAAFIGFKIGISPMKAPFIGKQSTSNVDKALSLDNNNIQANIEKANILYYAPSMFGGDKQAAMVYYLKAIDLFEEKKQNTDQNWMYLSLLTRVGELYTSQEKLMEAKILFEKCLRIAPDFLYVKNELLPALLVKMQVK